MKHLFLLLFVFAIGATSMAQEGAVITFEEEKFDFGEVEEGPKVTTEFVFKNTGNEALILSNVKASCGCTVPEWPREPILPGEESSITVTYNTANRKGGFNKSITISSNATEATKVISIKGNVIEVIEEETMPVKQPLMMAPAAK